MSSRVRLGMRRDYKTRERYIMANLRRHTARMAELIAAGMPKDDASRKAYDEICGRV